MQIKFKVIYWLDLGCQSIVLSLNSIGVFVQESASLNLAGFGVFQRSFLDWHRIGVIHCVSSCRRSDGLIWNSRAGVLSC